MQHISFITHEISYRLRDQQRVAAWIGNVLRCEGRSAGTVSVILCSDEYLLSLNRQFLEHDYYTDIITFDLSSGNLIEGELYISIDRVRENATDRKISVRDELHRVIIHGMLHLAGYKDKTGKDQQIMRNKEDEALKMRSW